MNKINAEKVSHETYFAINHAQETVEKALRFLADPDKVKRLEEVTCKRCYYIWTGRISGQAFTDVPCGICEMTVTYANTDTNKLCNDCAKKNELCAHCGADLHLRPRRKFERKY